MNEQITTTTNLDAISATLMSSIESKYSRPDSTQALSGTKAFNAWLTRYAVSQVEDDNTELEAKHQIKEAKTKLNAYAKISTDTIETVEEFQGYWALYGLKIQTLNALIIKYEEILRKTPKNEFIKEATEDIRKGIILCPTFEETRENIAHYFDSRFGVKLTTAQLEELLPSEKRYNRNATARSKNNGFKSLKTPEQVFKQAFIYNLFDMAIRGKCITVKWVKITKKRGNK